MKEFNIKKKYAHNSLFQNELRALKKELGINTNVQLVEHMVFNYRELLHSLPISFELKQPYEVCYSDGSKSILELTEKERLSEGFLIQENNLFPNSIHIVSVTPIIR